jgi:hypothetical protein
MRFTVIDPRGRVSFIAPCSTLEALVAACASQNQPRTVEQLLRAAEPFVGDLVERVLSGLAVFDEHNTRENLRQIHAVLRETRPARTPPFRVLDDVTREASLQPVRSGLVIFNLHDRRIVQVQNSYREVARKGAVQVHDGERWTRLARRYEVPETWQIVP